MRIGSDVKNARRLQVLIKSMVLIVATYYAIAHQIKGVLGAPSIHALCPFGGLESLFNLALTGTYVKKIFPATMVLFVATIVMGIVLRRAFCGWVCPLGLLQEIFTRIGRGLKIPQNAIPKKLDRALKYLKYPGLIIIIFFTWKTGELIFAPYDPWAAYGHIAGGWAELSNEFLIGFVFLIVGVLGSLAVPQNWCKYFCPMGAFLALLSRISPARIVRDTDTCINCKACSGICPVSIDVAEKKEIKDPECYDCGDCITVCPVNGTLTYRIFKKKISWLVYGSAAVLIFFASIYSAKALRLWSSNYSAVDEVLVDEKGELDPRNIRGSLTLRDISEAFKVPMPFMLEKLGLPEDLNTCCTLKEISKQYPVGTGQVSKVVSSYLGGQYEDEGLIEDKSEDKGLFSLPQCSPETQTCAPAEDNSN